MKTAIVLLAVLVASIGIVYAAPDRRAVLVDYSRLRRQARSEPRRPRMVASIRTEMKRRGPAALI